MSTVLKYALSLSVEDRLQLIEEIWDSLVATPELIPVGRFGKVEEVAEVVVALAKDAYITGQTINVNGGWYFS